MIRKIKVILITLLISSLIISCKEQKSVTMQGAFMQFDIDNIPKSDELKLSEITDSLIFIELKTPKEVLIGEISEILIYNDFIFVLDSKGTNRVYQFSRNGELIRIIGNPGKGPGEYLRADDMSIDRFNDLLFVLSRQDRKVNIYEIHDGQHLTDNILDFFATEIEIICNQHIAVFNHDVHNLSNRFGDLMYNVLITNREFSKIYDRYFETFTMYGIGKSVLVTGRYFINDGSYIYLSWRFNDTTYRFKENTFMPYIFFNFGDKRVKYNNFEESGSDIIVPKVLDGTFHTLIKPVIITSSTFITQYVAVTSMELPLATQLYYVLGSKNNGSVISANRIIDDMHNSIFNFPIGSHEAYFISAFFPEDYINSVDDSAHELYFSGTGTILKRFGNPVIVLTKFNI